MVLRAGWMAVTLLAVVLAVWSTPAGFGLLLRSADARSLAGLGLSAETYATYALGLDVAVVAAHIVIASVVFWRRSDQGMCLLVAFALSTNGAIIPLSLVHSSGELGPAGTALAGVVIYCGLVSSVGLLYVFPDGRFVPGWTRWLAVVWAGLALPAIFFPRWAVSVPSWPVWLQLLALLVWTGTGGFAQVYRYLHVASPVQRQQAKWGLLGILAAALAPFAYFLPFVILPALSAPRVPNLLYQRVGAEFFAFSLFLRLVGLGLFAVIRMLFPVSFSVAILRYRLWDIDVIIRRTLIYSVFTASLVLVYLLSVVLFQTLLRLVTGDAGQSQLAVVGSTLAIAALFTPLRNRVQDAIDRRFYRRKYDAARTLANFARAARDVTDLDELVRRLVGVVDETMQPAQTWLWLPPGETGRIRGGRRPEDGG